MRISWLSYLHCRHYTGGAELAHRTLIDVGRRRGHDIQEAALLHGRPQRALRRAGLLRSAPRVDWTADAFVIANIRNAPAFPRRFPEGLVDRALATGRAAVLQDAYVDVCPHDLLPCDGDNSRCPATCDRSFARKLYSNARVALFVSPMQRDLIAGVVDTPLPREIIIRPIVDVGLFRRFEFERDIDVLYVGTINEAKGYSQLLERFGPERLTFVGRNDLGRPVEGRWLGPVSQRDLPAIYNRARTFAHLPRWYEPAGRTPVEATLCGCEVVLNDRVGVKTHALADWTDPSVIARNPERFWDEFEGAYR